MGASTGATRASDMRGGDTEQPDDPEDHQDRRAGIVQGAIGEDGVGDPQRDHHHREVGVQHSPGAGADWQPVRSAPSATTPNSATQPSI